MSLNGAQFITYNLEGFNGAIGCVGGWVCARRHSGSGLRAVRTRHHERRCTGHGCRCRTSMRSAETRRRARSSSGPMVCRSPDATQRIIADPNPKYTMSYSSSVRWHKLSLSGLLDVRKGGSVWNGTRGILDFFGTGKDTKNRTMTNGQYGVNYATKYYPTTAGPGQERRSVHVAARAGRTGSSGTVVGSDRGCAVRRGRQLCQASRDLAHLHARQRDRSRVLPGSRAPTFASPAETSRRGRNTPASIPK